MVQLSKDATIGQLVSKLRPLVSCEQLSLWQRQDRIVTLVGEPATYSLHDSYLHFMLTRGVREGFAGRSRSISNSCSGLREAS